MTRQTVTHRKRSKINQAFATAAIDSLGSAPGPVSDAMLLGDDYLVLLTRINQLLGNPADHFHGLGAQSTIGQAKTFFMALHIPLPPV